MAEGKLDLPEDLLSSKPSDHSWTPKEESSGGSYEEKVPVEMHDEAKDQVVSESSIPLSPQWLYNKPSEAKMDARPPTSVSLGTSNEAGQKDGRRLDGSEDRKDWRKIATENEGSRRWREEERETGLLGARRDRRKTDRRVDSVSIRETVESNRNSSSDRWHDGSNRNSGHETRRDSKWSSRWGPEDKEKDSRIEKKTDVEKEKEDTHNDNQTSIGSNRSASEREPDSRDKWRPRHRMEVHSTGSASYRAAPGFGFERGRVEGLNVGFTFGRGRSNAISKPSSAVTIGPANSYKSEGVIGKPNLTSESFCYPRGKLLDIYRWQKHEISFAKLPDEMEESLPISQVGIVEPLAFATPNTEEEAILSDIWRGKITSSGVVYNSFRKGRSSENVSGIGDSESAEGNQGMLSSVLIEETAFSFQEVANDDACQKLYPYLEKEVDLEGVENKVTADGVAKILSSDDSCSAKEMGTALQLNIGENGEMVNSAVTEQFCSEDTESSPLLDVKSRLPDDSSSLFVLHSPKQNQNSTVPPFESNNLAKDLERGVPPEELYFYYIDPLGNTQGPFLGADIILWFEEGYFGTELPVRLADAPEGTPFQNLGEVIPHLKLSGGYPSSEAEQFTASEKNLEPSLPIASVPKITDSSSVNDLCQQFSEFNCLPDQHAPMRTSEPEASLQLPNSEGQSFHDFAAQEEEIVFPGRPGNTGYPTVTSSEIVRDHFANSNQHPHLSNELAESGFSYQNNNKLHPFGLLWSELEGSHARHSEASDMPSSVGRTAPYGSLTNPTSVAEKWPDVYRQDTLSGPSLLQDAIAARHLSHVEREPSHFDLADQLMSLQFRQQQQLQQRNMMTSHARLNESHLEHVPSQNLIHQQVNQAAPDLEQMLALQLQQQQQQLQLQHQLQQQQQFHQQQKLLQERQQSQVQQMLLEQLLHGQIPDPGLPQSHVDPIRTNNVLDQVLLEQQLLHELQQRSLQLPRHFVPSVEQLAQAKLGPVPHQEQQREMFDILSRAQHGQMQSLEHKIVQEQLQARQLAMALRQQPIMEEERHIDRVWPVNENDQFLRSLAGNHRAHSLGVSPLDFYQRQQNPSHEEQLSHLERNISFQDRIRQALYEPESLQFERSLSVPAGASGMNMDVVNAMVHAQGLDMQGARMQSVGQVGTFSSGIHPHNRHHPIAPNQFHASHLDGIEGPFSENNGQANDWMESRIHQLHINAERQRREPEIKMISEDPSSWMSDGSNDDKSRQLLMELLHQKSGHQPVDSLQMNDRISSEKRSPSSMYPGLGSSDHPFSVVPDLEASLNNSFKLGPYGSNTCESVKVSEGQASNLDNNEMLPFRSDSGAMYKGHSFLPGIYETTRAISTDSNIIDQLSMNKEYLDVERRKHGSKNQGLAMGSVSEIQDAISEQTRLVATDRGDIPVNGLSRHSSIGVTGFYDDKIGPQPSFIEDVAINQVPVPTSGQDNILLRRPPVSRASSSQEGLSELVSETVIRTKNSLSSVATGGNPVNQGADITVSGKKDMRFRRTSSCGDADASEPLFIDMLKSNVKKTTPEIQVTAGVSESADGTQGGRGGKKKGKKGRQIDPALLGFKVTSNRIMMGEIQRIED